MKSQVTPIIPVAALVVATLAAGAAMWHRLLVDVAGAAASNAVRGAVAAPKADADTSTHEGPADSRRDDGARQPTNAVTPAPR